VKVGGKCRIKESLRRAHFENAAQSEDKLEE
jgi:hypothetical protein